MTTLDQLLAEYRAVTASERNHQLEAEAAAARRRDLIRKMHATGQSYAAIGELVGLTRGRVHRLATR